MTPNTRMLYCFSESPAKVYITIHGDHNNIRILEDLNSLHEDFSNLALGDNALSSGYEINKLLVEIYFGKFKLEKA